VSTTVRYLVEMVQRHRGEARIVALFRVTAPVNVDPTSRIPYDPVLDTVVYELQLRHGRADIAIFHSDGSATVIEVKDGARGFTHVVQGIGQASLYASQLSQARAGLKCVRRCLLWTSTGDIGQDMAIEDACTESGTVALPWGTLAAHSEALERLANGGGSDGR
jgi:hypothetical protein